MKNKYSKIALAAFLLTANFAIVLPALSKSIHFVPDSNKSTLKIKDNRPNRPVFSSEVPENFKIFIFKATSKPNTNNTQSNKTSATKTISSVSLDQNKPLDNVKVYPNPVSNQLNLTYTLKNESVVTIKIMDVLGNEVLVLMSKKMDAGEQNNKFLIETKLSTGFYFVRLSAGSESIIKRISVL
jgi:hypothetical protein